MHLNKLICQIVSTWRQQIKVGLETYQAFSEINARFAFS